jgi:hypothetical protein
MDAERLDVELSSRMKEVVPADFTITVDGDMLWFSHDGIRRAGSYGCQWVKKGEGSIDDLIVRACELALNDLQDFVMEATTERWPGSGGFPRSGARMEGRSVNLWFGEREHPTVQLRPLPLDS